RGHAFRVDDVRRRPLTDLVAGAAGAGPARVAALDHEALHDPVERQVVVEALAGERDERAAGARRLFRIELELERSATGLDGRDVCLLRREAQARRGLLAHPLRRRLRDALAALPPAGGRRGG